MTPYHNHEPMKMNLLLAREDPPRLEGEFSRSFKDFVNVSGPGERAVEGEIEGKLLIKYSCALARRLRSDP